MVARGRLRERLCSVSNAFPNVPKRFGPAPWWERLVAWADKHGFHAWGGTELNDSCPDHWKAGVSRKVQDPRYECPGNTLDNASKRM